MWRKTFALTLAGTALAGSGPAQTVELDRLRFTTDGQRIEEHMGQEALVLNRGRAWLDDVSLEDVVIELDVALPETFGFAGVGFRAADDRNYEYYYLRAHRSGYEDATQYMPVFNGLGGWQIYAGPDYAAPLPFVHGRWMHLKLVAVGDRLDVYLDSNDPVHSVGLLREARAGAIGLVAGGEPTRFANLKVRPAGPAELRGAPTPGKPVGADDYIGRDRRVPREGAALVEAFRVSEPFPEAALPEAAPIDPDTGPWAAPGWHRLEVEPEGIANLARLHGHQDGNTVFAATTLRSDRARIVPVRVGFSDRARVYLNGRPIFGGADEWRSRDFRFLGIIGLHDTVYLPLEAGENALWIAVSEGFGGWGVMLEVPVVDGVRVSTD